MSPTRIAVSFSIRTDITTSFASTNATAARSSHIAFWRSALRASFVTAHPTTLRLVAASRASSPCRILAGMRRRR